jgi:hypothetical protein
VCASECASLSCIRTFKKLMEKRKSQFLSQALGFLSGLSHSHMYVVADLSIMSVFL